jgi:glutathione peroxidase
MKRNLLLPVFFLMMFSWQSSVYNIQVQTIDGNNVSLSSYQGKKIIAIEFKTVNPDSAQLRYLDSLQTGSSSIRVIAVPAIDFGGTVSEENLRNLRASLGLHFLITKPAAVKKTAGSGQHPLFKWLTHVNDNGHFDNEVEVPGQFFIIGTNGILYSLLRKETPHNVVSAVLSQQVNE